MTEKERAAAKVLIAIAEAIRDMGDKGAPLGPMYAALMTHGMSYEGFTAAIDALAKAGVIRVSNNCAFFLRFAKGL
jgi:hypothetical protein